MASSREYPERPVVGIGGVIIDQGRTLLIRRGNEPLLGELSIPGGTLEIGESLQEGVVRELLEETGIEVRVLELIEVFDRIYLADSSTDAEMKRRPRFHFVIVDYLCERLAGEPRARRGTPSISPHGDRDAGAEESIRNGSRSACRKINNSSARVRELWRFRCFRWNP